MPDDSEYGRRPYDNPSVLSLVVDILNRVETKLDQGLARVEAQLDTKADRADVNALRGHLDAHATRITSLEESERLRKARAEVHQQRDQRSFFSRKNTWAIVSGAVITLATLALAVAAVVQLP